MTRGGGAVRMASTPTGICSDSEGAFPCAEPAGITGTGNDRDSVTAGTDAATGDAPDNGRSRSSLSPLMHQLKGNHAL